MTSVLTMLKEPRMWWALGMSAAGARAVAQGLARFLYPRLEHRRRLLSHVLWVCFSMIPLFILGPAMQSSLIYIILPWKYTAFIEIIIKEPSNVWIFFATLFTCGVPLCLVLTDPLAVLSERLSGTTELRTPPLFRFAATSVFFLAMVTDPIYGADMPFQFPRFAGFAVCAAVASLEAGFAHYALKNNRAPAPYLAASCLFAVAAAMDSPAAAALLLPFLPIRLRYLLAENDPETSGEDEQDEWLDDLGEQIDELRRAINSARREINGIEARSSEFWMLPPDRETLLRLINDGTLILPETRE